VVCRRFPHIKPSVSESLGLCVGDSSSTPHSVQLWAHLISFPSSVDVQNAWSYLHVLVRPTQFVIVSHRNALIKSGFKMDV
jgi:hypothetical protein